MIPVAFFRVLFFMALIMPICVLAVSPSRAQYNTSTSSAEDVAIAFFQTGGTNPNFEQWARSSQEYKVAAPAMANEVLSNEKQRLFKKWRSYKADENVLTVSGSVRIELKTVTTKEGNEEHWMHMAFTEGAVTYFPYKFLDYAFAVIPQQIESMLIQPLQKQQYELFVQSFGGLKTGNATLSVQLKPSRSYLQQPYMIDNKEQWVLLCDVATLSLLNNRNSEPMWNYASDWYVSPITQELRDLYQKPGIAPLQ